MSEKWPNSLLLFSIVGGQLQDIFYDICDYFMDPLHKSIFGLFPHRISPGALKGLKDIGDWYVKKYYTYIQIYGTIGAPHLLPKYVPDKLLARDIVYHTIEKGATTYLSEKNKKY
jgi:hypothetical protein